jgi:pyruvate/2-oxoglutarate dehydrogenase complex dihydrolipoamide dehydrogenase (E3) component
MASAERYDAVVIGAGSGGRGAAKRLSRAGMRVAMLERELVGGECPFWACMPSKTLLRPAEVISEAAHTAGLARPAHRWEEIRAYRDYMNSGLDDTKKYDAYTKLGIEIIRGEGRIVAPGRVEAQGSALTAPRVLESERIIVATGSAPAIPKIDGLDKVPYWTNREATTFDEVPASTIVLGGGPVGVELGQMLNRYGSKVTIVEAAERLLAREEPQVSQLLAGALEREDIELRTGSQADRVEADSGLARLHLADGRAIEAQRLLVASGRRARVDGLGLEAVGVEHDDEGIKIDARCRAAAGVWAVGDVTGVAPFTHVAAYQARIAAADILGEDPRADYSAIPRVVFSDPEVAAVGLTSAQANEAEIETVEAVVDISELDRTETYGHNLEGKLGLLADAPGGVLVGAWAVAPLAGEWIHSAVIAIKAKLPVAVLRDTIIQFPTFSEGLVTAADRLELG